MSAKYVIGNWKMHNDLDESLGLLDELCESNAVEIIVAPSFLYLYSIVNNLKGKHIHVAAQNMHYEDEGAFSGEVSPKMLKDVGCDYVILGHSERRYIFNESNQLINKKTLSAKESNLCPIICVGENKKMSLDEAREFIHNQLSENLKGLNDVNGIIFAYEPVWAVGTGDIPSNEHVNEIHKFIKHDVCKVINSCNVEDVAVVYGGSVNSQNAASLFAIDEVDGFIVGGASLNASEFNSIVEVIESEKF